MISGLLTCAAYAFPPNELKYCGPFDKTDDLKGYQDEQINDDGLKNILAGFHTLYPYLSLIAYENNIRDPLDARVVEAYWIGNSLLKKIPGKKLYDHFSEALNLRKKITKKDFSYLVGKIDDGALPHHTFHVLNVFTRTGHQNIVHTLETMDACRIGWGKIVNNLKLRVKTDNTICVETQPLVLKNGKLALGKPLIKKIYNPLIRKSEIGNQISTISFHWNTFCDILSDRQVKNLKFYTEKAIQLANLTL
ncbi:hypothetical protein A3A93_02655 [Candidatus Roizmanbacteria bacterium RIFCSPLOWO2_01_FULL_38_12]|uniref:Uncharacterized protein n=1 Tax=Candidatus Roizmanbacteria bacterium RIFCSPLOWO2_01_FULL_38_12 TaxID=1802061 RepID=A0A1F7IUH6_9BACT|nr:MAG: hypothetical protein A2861_02725 [Candidatus Roizmanbacteria bacterium RIFCSPHIGHO2_01_FULL_38_15]OGK34358.1 MAG: hypothetical protein A3F59_04950 [Candidatus Roizmanbacteria bacterium RIFCSPHIGHO2_12_FULL_38_13]OGK46999.1 MAG: hypothetical protein A3A93_02655 [Candidatus Roizmanbacteria bacterium RIFCSPLOWO2_01_FULL_38_12]